MANKPNVLDLFCGAGGMSLGFHNAGCNIIGGIDNNPYAINTHHKNFSNSKLVLQPQDINHIEPENLSIKKDEVDILVGGPPCQVYSHVGIGKMKSLGRDLANDPRNFLYRNFIKFITYYSPPFFVMENVDSLAGKEIFKIIIKELESGIPQSIKQYPGYNIKHEILTACDYGVPQIRKRLFIVGVRKDLNLEFNFPNSLTEKKVSVEEAIGDLIPITPQYVPMKSKYNNQFSVLKGRFSPKRQTDVPKPYLSPPQSSYQKKMRLGINKRSLPDSVMNHICRSHEYHIRNSRLLNPKDEWLDLPIATRKEIMEETKYLREQSGKPPSSSDNPNGRIVRAKRPSTKGLLLLYPLDPAQINSNIPVIGFIISFPNSNTATTIEYKVNNPYWEQEYGEP